MQSISSLAPHPTRRVLAAANHSLIMATHASMTLSIIANRHAPHIPYRNLGLTTHTSYFRFCMPSVEDPATDAPADTGPACRPGHLHAYLCTRLLHAATSRNAQMWFSANAQIIPYDVLSDDVICCMHNCGVMQLSFFCVPRNGRRTMHQASSVHVRGTYVKLHIYVPTYLSYQSCGYLPNDGCYDGDAQGSAANRVTRWRDGKSARPTPHMAHRAPSQPPAPPPGWPHSAYTKCPSHHMRTHMLACMHAEI